MKGRIAALLQNISHHQLRVSLHQRKVSIHSKGKLAYLPNTIERLEDVTPQEKSLCTYHHRRTINRHKNTIGKLSDVLQRKDSSYPTTIRRFAHVQSKELRLHTSHHQRKVIAHTTTTRGNLAHIPPPEESRHTYSNYSKFDQMYGVHFDEMKAFQPNDYLMF